jgi:hypothetical protein
VRLEPSDHGELKVAGNGMPAGLVKVTLRRGVAVTGRVIGPDGAAVGDGVVVCRHAHQPAGRPEPRSLPVRHGTFSLPGCVAGRAYPVLVLDPERELAAVTELQTPIAGETPTVVRLAPCGAAAVRLVDAVGRPVTGTRAKVWVWLPDDHPAWPATARVGIPHAFAASSVDPRHYVLDPVTDEDGLVKLPALVPGLQYSVRFGDTAGRSVTTPPFRVTAGETVRLPDVVVPPDAQADTPRTESEAPAP